MTNSEVWMGALNGNFFGEGGQKVLRDGDRSDGRADAEGPKRSRCCCGQGFRNKRKIAI